MPRLRGSHHVRGIDLCEFGGDELRMPIFKSKFPDVALPQNATISEFIFNNWTPKEEARLAFIDGFSGEQITFGEFKNLTQKLARGLQLKLLRKGDVVALVSPNSILFPVIVQGTILAGGIVSTANPISLSSDLAKQLADSKPKFIFITPDLHEKVAEAVKLSKHPAPIIHIGANDFESLLNNDGKVQRVNVSPNDIALLPYSSGTTGLPKGVMLPHKSIIANVLQSTAIDGASYDNKTVAADILPMFHIYGILYYLVMNIYLKHTVVVYTRFDMQAVLEGIQKYKVTHLNVAPPVALAFAKHPLVEKYDLSSLRILNSGAAPLGKDLQEEVFRRTKVAIRQGYGMTETPTATIMNPYSPGAIRKLGSSGILMPNVEAKIISVEDGRQLGENERGELCLRCPNMMLGYLNKPEENIIDKDGFLHTGDIAYVDEDGDFFVVDRLKELIKYKGFQVPPAELEGLIITHPKVLDVAVIGKPDEHAGELPTAFVVLKPNQAISGPELVDWVNGQTSTYKHLRGGVIFIDQIPKTLSGKILRRVLRDRFAKPASKL